MSNAELLAETLNGLVWLADDNGNLYFRGKVGRFNRLICAPNAAALVRWIQDTLCVEGIYDASLGEPMGNAARSAA